MSDDEEDEDEREPQDNRLIEVEGHRFRPTGRVSLSDPPLIDIKCEVCDLDAVETYDDAFKPDGPRRHYVKGPRWTERPLPKCEGKKR